MPSTPELIISLVGWLAGPLEFDFMRRGLVASVLVGALCATIGAFVVLKGLAFIGDALAHASFAGVVNLLLLALLYMYTVANRPALRRAADWLWANAWMAGAEAMWYEQPGDSSAAPDLNLLIAPLYAFLYRQTGVTQYRDQGDALFAGGVRQAFLGGGKQFNQNYWWSFDYVKWRTELGDKAPPTVALTAPPADAPVAGIIAVAASASDDVAVVGVRFKLDGLDLGGRRREAGGPGDRCHRGRPPLGQALRPRHPRPRPRAPPAPPPGSSPMPAVLKWLAAPPAARPKGAASPCAIIFTARGKS